MFVIIPTGGNLVQVGGNKQSIVEGRIEKLERKQAKALQPSKSNAHQDRQVLREQNKPEQA